MVNTILLYWQLYLQLEVILSGLTSNQNLDYGSQYFLSNFLSNSINLSSNSFQLTNTRFIENNPSSYNASLLFDSYINITSPDTDGAMVLNNISFALSQIDSLQVSYATGLSANQLEYSSSNIYFAQDIINSTLSYINITQTDLVQIGADDDTSDPRYNLQKHLVSIVIGAIFVGISTIVFIILNYFPENYLARKIRRYQPLITQEPGIQLMAPPIPRTHPNFAGSTTAATRTITNGTNISEV
jgi:hypothetical protein